MKVRIYGRKVITFACGQYTVRGPLAPTPSYCLSHGEGCLVTSVIVEHPRVDTYDNKTKTWHRGDEDE
jgi:hypothetical protein